MKITSPIARTLVLVLFAAGASAALAQPCIHMGGQVVCPPGITPGSTSVNFEMMGMIDGIRWSDGNFSAGTMLTAFMDMPMMPPTMAPVMPPVMATPPPAAPPQMPTPTPTASVGRTAQEQAGLTQDPDRNKTAPGESPAGDAGRRQPTTEQKQDFADIFFGAALSFGYEGIQKVKERDEYEDRVTRGDAITRNSFTPRPAPAGPAVAAPAKPTYDPRVAELLAQILPEDRPSESELETTPRFLLIERLQDILLDDKYHPPRTPDDPFLDADAAQAGAPQRFAYVVGAHKILPAGTPPPRNSPFAITAPPGGFVFLTPTPPPAPVASPAATTPPPPPPANADDDDDAPPSAAHQAAVKKALAAKAKTAPAEVTVVTPGTVDGRRVQAALTFLKDHEVLSYYIDPAQQAFLAGAISRDDRPSADSETAALTGSITIVGSAFVTQNREDAPFDPEGNIDDFKALLSLAGTLVHEGNHRVRHSGLFRQFRRVGSHIESYRSTGSATRTRRFEIEGYTASFIALDTVINVLEIKLSRARRTGTAADQQRARQRLIGALEVRRDKVGEFKSNGEGDPYFGDDPKPHEKKVAELDKRIAQLKAE